MPALLPSERPEVGRAKYHWVTMFSKPPTWIWVTMLLALVAAIIWPWPMVIPFAVLFGFNAFLRWQYWDQALVVLTQRRIIRVIGVPEATTTEVSLRVDRIHGLGAAADAVRQAPRLRHDRTRVAGEEQRPAGVAQDRAPAPVLPVAARDGVR